jgi:tRNA pseudouridine38-40 synthase
VLQHVRIDLGYNGAHFYGSQRQPGVRTVQGELEEAVERITGERCRLTFSGRTDRGVHAVGQVASGTITWREPLEKLRYGLDSITGHDLAVYRVAEVPETFSARFSARSREYRYRIWSSRRRPVLAASCTYWLPEEFDISLLDQAAKTIVGEHDFRSFTGKGFGSGKSTRNTRRTVFDAGWRRMDDGLEPQGDQIEFRIAADSFLPHMVRNLVGAQVVIGRGDAPPGLMRELIGRRDRTSAPEPAPPEGLVLWRVTYR